MQRKQVSKIEKVLCCLELCSDYLSRAKNKKDAEAYQIVAKAMFDVMELKGEGHGD